MAKHAQLSLDELDPDAAHGHDGFYALEYGYRARCKCGYVGSEQLTKRLARGSIVTHLSLTVSGARVVALLRKS